MKTPVFLLIMTFVLFNVSIASSVSIPPYYPEKKNVKYVPSTIPLNEISVSLNNGVEFQLDQFDTVQSLNGLWKFSGIVNSEKPYNEDVDIDKCYWKEDYDDTKWDIINVPLNWYEKYPKARRTDATFVKGWYRKSINIPDEQQGKQVILQFDVIGYDATLYVNGNLVGIHHGDFTPWEVDITKWVRFGRSNVLAIRVLSDFGPKFNGMPAQHTYGSQWGIGNIKAGLWQDVNVHYKPAIYIKKMLISPVLSDFSINIDYWMENNSSQHQQLTMYGVVCSAMKKDKGVYVANVNLGTIFVPQGSTQGTTTIKLNKPELWTLENPYLYYLSLSLMNNKDVVTANTERFGFRDFKVKGRNFYLNNERMYVFGESIGSVYFGGYARTNAEETTKLVEALTGFKSLGYNILRTVHMPILPLAIKLADEIGIMLFDEWSWSFTNDVNKDKFEKNNLEEIKEWVYRDYNNPSVVMWCCGNEVVFGGNKVIYDQLNKQVALVRELDKSGRPISNFSGEGGPDTYGKEKLETDMLDAHRYGGSGYSNPPWTHWDEGIKKLMELNRSIYGERDPETSSGQRLNKPFVIWEFIGYSWGNIWDQKFTLNNIDVYAGYAKRSTSWAQPNGIGYTGTIGLAAALDPNNRSASAGGTGNKVGASTYGKRTIELIRYNDEEIQGFAPFFIDWKIEAATLWNQPLYCGLRGKNGLMFRNVFATRKYVQKLFIVNSQSRDLKDLQFQIMLVDISGNKTKLNDLKIPKINAWEKKEQDIEIQIPENLTMGKYQMRLTITNDKDELSRNFYDIFIQREDILSLPLKTQKRICVFTLESQKNNPISSVLTNLNVKHKLITTLEKLDKYDVLIISPSMENYAILERIDVKASLMSWIRNGGVLIQLEQGYSGKSILGDVLQSPNTFVDVAIPKHPVFQGLEQGNFDVWDNQDFGNVIDYGCGSFTINALAVRGPLPGSIGVLNAISEGIYEKGHIFMSQVNATKLWGIDSVASTYLRNLLTYVLEGDKPFELVRNWDFKARDREFYAKRGQIIHIDLKQYVNRSFSDDVSGDEKGGWTDQGDNDFRTMPLGAQKLSGITFDIISPDKNEDKSCIVLKGLQRPYFLAKVEGIKVDECLRQVFFLHTLAWGSSMESAGEYRVRYEDGAIEKIILKNGVNICDWWNPYELPDEDVRLSLCRENSLKRKVGLFVLRWENPKMSNKILSIDFESYGNAVPILVAISGEKYEDVKPMVIDNFEDKITPEWVIPTYNNKPIPESTMILCDKSNEPENVFNGNKSLKITMPPQNEGISAVIFRKFSIKELSVFKFNYLTFWIKSNCFSNLYIVLPKNDWSDRLSYDLSISKSDWKKVVLDLYEDMGFKNKKWTLSDLRGEIFIYNGRPGNTFNYNNESMFYLDDVQFE